MDPIQDKSIPKVTKPLQNMHAISFNFEGHPFKFLLKKPSVEFALLAILDMIPPFQVLTDADS